MSAETKLALLCFNSYRYQQLYAWVNRNDIVNGAVLTVRFYSDWGYTHEPIWIPVRFEVFPDGSFGMHPASYCVEQYTLY